MPLPQTMIIGNLTRDPELRFTGSGTAVATMNVATQDRKRDADGKWVDGDPTFFTITAWRQAAENIVESLHKGDRVMAWGRVRQRSYETREGDKRTVYEMEADEVGASTAWARVTVTRSAKSSQPLADDPWASDAPF